METLSAAAMLLLITAISPGPNNLLVLRTAAVHGLTAAWPGIAGIVIGGLLLLAMASTGLEQLLDRWPELRVLILMAGATWLAWAGLRMAWTKPAVSTAAAAPADAASLPGLLGFQLINPKAWTLVLTLSASVPPGETDDAARLLLPVLFIAIPIPCLLAWAWAGAAASRWLQAPARRARLDRIMGTLLATSALTLLLSLHEGNPT